MTALVDHPVAEPPLPPRRRRLVLWICLGAGALAAVLVGVLATSTPANQAVEQSSPLVGRPAPPISGPDQSGSTVTLSSYRGRWVLVNFAASWCTPCQQELPQLLTFASRNAAPTAAAIITVEYDPTELSSLRHLLASRHAGWPVVSDDPAKVTWGIFGIPESYLVDPAGTVVAKYFGGVQADDLENVIAAYPTSGLAPVSSAGASVGAS